MSKMRNLVLTASAIGFAGSAALATDYTALRADSYIHDRLLGASIAYLIDEQCDSISARKLYALSQVLKMQSHAKSLGYSTKEIAAYVDSKDEQARFRAIAEPYLAEQGAVTGDAESYCVVGRAEIEKGTITGSLLRAR